MDVTCVGTGPWWGEDVLWGEVVYVYISHGQTTITLLELDAYYRGSRWSSWLSVGGGGGARVCQKYKIKPRIYLRVLTPTMDSDGGAKAAEATTNNATMILREGGSVLVAKTM